MEMRQTKEKLVLLGGIVLATLSLACDGDGPYKSDGIPQFNVEPNYRDHNPRIAMDGSGDAMIVWERKFGEEIKLYARRHSVGGSIPLSPGGFELGIEGHQVAMDASHNAIAVWEKNGDIYANRYISGGWQGGVKIDQHYKPGDNPQIAMDGSGRAVAVWAQDGDIHANRYVLPGGWQGEQTIEMGIANATGPQIAMFPGGYAVAVWEQDGDIYANNYISGGGPGSGWQSEQVIDTGSETATGPQIASNLNAANQTAIAVWKQGDDVYANRYVPGNVWEGAQPIGAILLHIFSHELPEVAMDASGSAIAVWARDHGGQDDGLYANRYVPGGWQGERRIGSDGEDPQIAIDDNGDAVAIWRDEPFFIVARNFEASSGWQNGWQAEEQIGDADNSSHPDIAMDASGIAIATWDKANPVSCQFRRIMATYKWGPPTARFFAAAPLLEVGVPVDFDAGSSSDDDGTIVLYEWDFDYDGSTFNVDATGVTATHTYLTAGTYTVMLRVTDNDGLMDDYTEQFTIGDATYSTIGGTVDGLVGVLELQNNGGDDLSINANGPFTFATLLPYGSSYNVTVLTQPVGYTCIVSNGSGTVYSSDVTDVAITCTITGSGQYTVGGTVSGMTGGILTLLNNGGDFLNIMADGPFTFATGLADGTAYNVTIFNQPTGQTCTVSNGSRIIAGADVTNVAVDCTSYTVGGTVSGMTGGTLVLVNNGGDFLNITADGPFTFSTGFADGESYDVTVLGHPEGQTCSVSNGSGTIVGADVTDVAVTCIAKYTLTVSNYSIGGSGKVTIDPGGIDCLSYAPDYCQVVGFDDGTVVTITAVPTSGGSYLDLWGNADGGSCTVGVDGNGNTTCTITMDSPKDILALWGFQ
jgi:hypothetical protein